MPVPSWWGVGVTALSSDSHLGWTVSNMEPVQLDESRTFFHALCRAIIFQQLSGKAAATIEQRFLQLWPDLTSPVPSLVLNKSPEELRAVGVSAAKAAALHDLSAKIESGHLDLESLTSMPDDEVRASIVQVRGLGVWSADMLLIFTLGRPDVWPTHDLGVKKGIQQLMNLPAMPKPKELEPIGDLWRPYRTLAALAAWRALDDPAT